MRPPRGRDGNHGPCQVLQGVGLQDEAAGAGLHGEPHGHSALIGRENDARDPQFGECGDGVMAGRSAAHDQIHHGDVRG